jgi:multidrug efflux pump
VNSANAGAIFVGAKPFEERAKHGPTGPELTASLKQRLGEIQEADVFVIQPPPVRGVGTAGGFKLVVQDRTGAGFAALQDVTDAYVDAARKDGTVTGVFSPYRAHTPQIFVDIDRVKAEKLNVPLANIFDTLQVYLGSIYVNDLNLFGRTFQVRAQAEGDFRAEPENISQLKARNANGGMVPLGSVLGIQWRSGPDRVVRYNLFPAAEINGDAAAGRSQGDALDAMERLADQTLPRGMGIEWTDIA